MPLLRLIQSEWGGRAFEAAGTLVLYRIPFETITPGNREQLIKLLDEAKDAQGSSVLLFGPGFMVQMGQDLPASIPADGDKLKVVWIGVTPPHMASDRHVASTNDQIKWVVLKALGKSPDLLVNVMASINKVLCPRFDETIFSSIEFYSYDPETDTELNLPADQVRDHFDRGTLQQWLEGLVKESDKLKESDQPNT